MLMAEQIFMEKSIKVKVGIWYLAKIDPRNRNEMEIRR